MLCEGFSAGKKTSNSLEIQFHLPFLFSEVRTLFALNQTSPFQTSCRWLTPFGSLIPVYAHIHSSPPSCGFTQIKLDMALHTFCYYFYINLGSWHITITTSLNTDTINTVTIQPLHFFSSITDVWEICHICWDLKLKISCNHQSLGKTGRPNRQTAKCFFLITHTKVMLNSHSGWSIKNKQQRNSVLFVQQAIQYWISVASALAYTKNTALQKASGCWQNANGKDVTAHCQFNLEIKVSKWFTQDHMRTSSDPIFDL